MARSPKTSTRPMTPEDLLKARLRALEAIREHQRAILARRGGVPVDVDSALDELRRHED